MGANLYSTFDTTLQSCNTVLFLKTVLKCCFKQFLSHRGYCQEHTLLSITFSRVELLFIQQLLTRDFLNLQNGLIGQIFKTPPTQFLGIFCVVSLACEICKIETSAVCIFCKSPIFVRKNIYRIYTFLLWIFVFVLPLKVYKEAPLYHVYRSQNKFFLKIPSECLFS